MQMRGDDNNLSRARTAVKNLWNKVFFLWSGGRKWWVNTKKDYSSIHLIFHFPSYFLSAKNVSNGLFLFFFFNIPTLHTHTSSSSFSTLFQVIMRPFVHFYSLNTFSNLLEHSRTFF
jgi:hypothetical protein